MLIDTLKRILKLQQQLGYSQQLKQQSERKTIKLRSKTPGLQHTINILKSKI